MRKTPFVSGEYYHIYNRGVDKRTIFSQKYDVDRFLKCMIEFNNVEPIGSLYQLSFEKHGNKNSKSNLVDIVCYCLNENHFHLILRCLKDNSISEYMKRIGGGYANYFNIKYRRSGALFQGKFKSRHIDSNAYLTHLSAYVNLNNKVHKNNGLYGSSWQEYLDNRQNGLCKKEIILKQFSNSIDYKNFAEESLGNILERKDRFREMETLLLEEK